MSATPTTIESIGKGGTSAHPPQSPWLRQMLVIFKLELRKNFFGRRAVLIYLLALMPVGLMAMVAVVTRTVASEAAMQSDFTQASTTYGGFFGYLILRTVIFFGCAWIFMNLIRGEVVDRSLHYYFLCPVRREVLLVSKYLSGLVASIVIFTFTTLGSLFFIYVAGYPASLQYLSNGPGLNHALAYVGITVLACLGYGAFFQFVGLYFRNPILPALAMYGWEWLNFLLPPVLKKVSVIHYLHSLEPVPLSQGPLAIDVLPTPWYFSVPGLIIFTAILLFLSGLRIRRMEIRYIGD